MSLVKCDYYLIRRSLYGNYSYDNQPVIEVIKDDLILIFVNCIVNILEKNHYKYISLEVHLFFLFKSKIKKTN